jgi:hypothetical protein
MRKLKSIDDRRSLELFVLRGVPGHIRSDNGPEFIAEAVQVITAVGSKTAYMRRAVRGRTDTSRASTPGSETNC